MLAGHRVSGYRLAVSPAVYGPERRPLYPGM